MAPRIICRLLGHLHDPQHYGRVWPEGSDGIGRHHARVTAECDRCGKLFQLTRVHLPDQDRGRHESAI